MTAKNFLTLVIIFGSLSLTIFSQKGKRKRIKSNPVKAVVTVKGNLGKTIKIPEETDIKIWNELLSETHKFKITFPSESGDVFIDNPKDDLFLYSKGTKKATYSVIVKQNIPKQLPENLDNFYDEMSAQLFFNEETALISTKKISINGLKGREIIFEQEKDRVFGRLFWIENRLYILSVHLEKKNYDLNFEKWINKFFDSFSAENKNSIES